MYDFDELVERRGTNCFKWDDVKDGDLLPMWVADMDFKSPPAVIEALEARARHGVFGYSGCWNTWYQVLLDWMKKRYGWEARREWIDNSPGVVASLSMLVRAYTHPGDQVIIQTPVYSPFYSVVRSNGCQLIRNPLIMEDGKYRMDLDSLRPRITSRTRAIILCSPHNPGGRVWSSDELKKLGEFCLERDIVMISDEIHCDLIFPEYRHNVLAALSPELEQNSAIVNAPSKTFNIAGIQAASTIIPNEKLRNAYRHVLNNSGIDIPNVFAVTAMEAAYTHGEAWLEELMIYVQANYRLVRSFIQERIPQIKVMESEGTFLVWLDCRDLGMDDHELETFFREQARLILSPGHIFGEEGRGFQRMNIGCPRSLVQEALLRLESAMKRMQSKGWGQ
ncbi:MAG: putative C-S lyase [Syntrophomonadaceae bacterium]|nr:putative C-S lyase [Syntrophomonadaceae bacterium]